mmetsp:Transcript_23118/g.54065  ORF Transcript_23118/g.54065 Transcript_23118/m.54065 type:complete len:203 (+) Transcript_23118:205-813(+)
MALSLPDACASASVSWALPSSSTLRAGVGASLAGTSPVSLCSCASPVFSVARTGSGNSRPFLAASGDCPGDFGDGATSAPGPPAAEGVSNHCPEVGFAKSVVRRVPVCGFSDEGRPCVAQSGCGEPRLTRTRFAAGPLLSKSEYCSTEEGGSSSVVPTVRDDSQAAAALSLRDRESAVLAVALSLAADNCRLSKGVSPSGDR